jgi:hypothetical protein
MTPQRTAPCAALIMRCRPRTSVMVTVNGEFEKDTDDFIEVPCKPRYVHLTALDRSEKSNAANAATFHRLSEIQNLSYSGRALSY